MDTGETGTGTTATTTATVGETETETETEGEPTGCEASYPLSVEPLVLAADAPVSELVDIDVHCGPPSIGLISEPGIPGTILLDPNTDDFIARVYRPALASDADGLEWPDSRLPTVIFSPGAGQQVLDNATQEGLYEHVFTPLVEAGFIVVAVEPPFPLGLNWTMAQRNRAMFCSLIWLQSPAPGAWSERDNNRLNCDVVAMGHSRGGEAAFLLTERFEDFQELSQIMDSYTLRATVGIAPRSRNDLDGDDPTGPIEAAKAKPYLALQGGNDHDPTGQAIRAYDLMAPEESVPLGGFDKSLVWAYDVPHNAWGGVAPAASGIDPLLIDKARAIGAEYIPSFLDWQVLENQVAVNRRSFTVVAEITPENTDFPLSVRPTSFWENIEPAYSQLGNRPSFSPDSRSVLAATPMHDSRSTR